MKNMTFSDVTFKTKKVNELTFREKLELLRLLDELLLDRIELSPLSGRRADTLMVKSIAETARHARVAIPLPFDPALAEETVSALKTANSPILQIVCPTSSVTMEYLFHLKPAALLEKAKEAALFIRDNSFEGEMILEDATRGDATLIADLIAAGRSAGITRFTFTDKAGNLTPDGIYDCLNGLLSRIDREGLTFGFCACDALSLASASALKALGCGITDLKVSFAEGEDAGAPAESTARAVLSLGETLGVTSAVAHWKLEKTAERIRSLFQEKKTSSDSKTEERSGEEKLFTARDDSETIAREVRRLGYELSDEEISKVYENFTRIAGKKENVSSREIEAIVASASFQVPATYHLEDYYINASNVITATAHIRLRRGDEILETVSVGDGPIDASFQAIEKLTGRHFELDDFQIRAVTESRSAMGETIVRLRSDGKLYSGRGLSTDILGSGIRAYLSALNRIVYEEDGE
ncbi:MAG: hypothetical protein II797_00690 [Clostridia bacterium]|nr:hypothetical protein [Clostridia bacterium]